MGTRWLGSVVFGCLWVLVIGARAVEFPGPAPGKATGHLDEHCLTLENASLRVTWDLTSGLRLKQAANRLAGGAHRAGGGEALVIKLADGTSIASSRMHLAEKPRLERIQPRPDAPRLCSRFGGYRATVPLATPDGRLDVVWQAMLRDGSNYVIQRVLLTPRGADVPLDEVSVLEARVAGARRGSGVAGSPVVTDAFFFACEHPLAAARVQGNRVVCSARCYRPVRAGETWSRSSVIGVVPGGQLRRAFLYYIERERARPYRLFLHYNSWWDIATGGKVMNEAECLDVIERFGRELVRRRGVTLDSFVFDDGWDDPKTLWGFHSGFPHGFAPLRDAAQKYGSAVGTWLSPWGGYGQAKLQRLEYGKTQGFETNRRGFSLAGPKYYARFRDACLEMIRQYDVNYFKFDGIGSPQGGSAAGADSEFAPDIEALLRLTTELRAARPDIYLSITTGTWPSPYWLWYGDSVWRGGHDANVHGVGSKRQQWLTYRDMIVRRMIVDRAPLYPLNSLMTVTVTYARLGLVARLGIDAESSPDVDELADEIRMAFASGTQLLELYVTPQRLAPRAWDLLAECARWSRANADVLVDVHWVGGDPGHGEPYGYAAWSPRKGILALRNPGAEATSLVLDVAEAFELPEGAPTRYRLTCPWREGHHGLYRPMEVRAGEGHAFRLEPFEVRVLEATPVPE